MTLPAPLPSRDEVGEPALVSRVRRIEGASHNELYDKDDYVTSTVATLTDFYETNPTEAVAAPA